ncbi:tyrosine-type recombinase/integrase [Mycoplasmopsis meleagridis]|uniref:tyrosine-type recombinase/integrase n=2 Tax=Mycoplasmopsis meleagridis TaxID=29561 RepID=UPI00073D3099|nr:tyrosine-type recombinase/integrase [Mycoplasmopsis meleagridis]KUH47174.1 hypothetical protein ASB56_02800 [Mycoplasmopsis meleagridis]
MFKNVYLEQFQKEMQKLVSIERLQASTLKDYCGVLRNIDRPFENLSELVTVMKAAFQNLKAQGRKHNTLMYTQTVYKRYFTWFKQNIDNLNKADFENEIGAIKGQIKTRKAYSSEELSQIFKFLDVYKDKFMSFLFKFYLLNGLRRSEWDCINWNELLKETNENKNIVEVRTRKNNNPRLIFLPKTSEYGNLWNEAQQFKELILSTDSYAIYLHFTKFRRWVRKYYPEFKQEINVHVLRHTCATNLVKRGLRAPEIAGWFGHKNLNTTNNTYIDPNSSSNISIIEFLSEENNDISRKIDEVENLKRQIASLTQIVNELKHSIKIN